MSDSQSLGTAIDLTTPLVHVCGGALKAKFLINIPFASKRSAVWRSNVNLLTKLTDSLTLL